MLLLSQPTRAPTPSDSYCSQEWERTIGDITKGQRDYYGKCCNECYNEFTNIYGNIDVNIGDTVWNSLDVFWNGVTVFLSVQICNVFPFDLLATRIIADAAFDDPDGAQFGAWLNGNWDAKDDVVLAEGVTWSPESEFRIPGGECKWTPSIPIDAPVNSEVVYRLADEAMYKSRLCLSIKNMVLDAGMVGPSGVPFMWTQPLDLSKISVIGDNDCVSAPACLNEHSPKVQQNFQVEMWNVQNKISVESSGEMKLNSGNGAEVNSAWLKEKYSMTDDWIVDVTVQHGQASCFWGLCPHEGSFGLTFQQESATKIGSGETGFGGFGAGSLSIVFDEPWGTGSASAKVYKDGATGDSDVLSTSWDVSIITSGEVNAFRVSYSAYSKVLQMWCNAGLEIDLNITPKITLQIDMNQIFTAGKLSCVAQR